MSVLAKGCIAAGVIKNFFADAKQEEGAYEMRFSIFRSIVYPAYMEYGQYAEGMKPLEGKKVLIIDRDVS
jgi:hypothetical protein